MPNIDDGGGYIDSGTWNTAPSGGGSTPPANGGVSGFQGTGATASGVSGAIQGIGNAVGDILTATGDQASAKEYTQAAVIALQNKQVEQGSLLTQTSAMNRQFQLAQGAQTAQISASGFNPGTYGNGGGGAITQGTQGGSSTVAGLRTMAFANFSMNRQAMISNNYLQQEAYQQQATADENAAKASNAAATGAFIGAGFSALSSIASIGMMAA